jgi:hypothetical protein
MSLKNNGKIKYNGFLIEVAEIGKVFLVTESSKMGKN